MDILFPSFPDFDKSKYPLPEECIFSQFTMSQIVAFELANQKSGEMLGAQYCAGINEDGELNETCKHCFYLVRKD